MRKYGPIFWYNQRVKLIKKIFIIFTKKYQDMFGKYYLGIITMGLTIGNLSQAKAQIPSGIYVSEQKVAGKTVHREIKANDSYIIYTEYETGPANFIRTMGGHYTTTGTGKEHRDTLKVKLEFNSDFKQDGTRELSFPFSLDNKALTIYADPEITFLRQEDTAQALDGPWLFATRGPDDGQNRRGDESPRKTLKFLMDGTFQWIAYNTDTMEFFGTGGGTFTSRDGKYVEHIRFFSRDNSRSGPKLEFDYEIKGDDWHHKGKNSKGEPLYEIWAKRGSNAS